MGARAHPAYGRERARALPAVGRIRVALHSRRAGRDDRVQEPPRAVQLGVGPRSEFRRDVHVRRRGPSRRPGRGAQRDLPRAGPREAAALVALAAIERRARRQRERSSSLRPRERVLRPLAGPRDGLHLRVLSDAGFHARGGAGREDGSRVPEAGAEARRTGDRSWMRLGRPRAVHGPAIRRDRSRGERVERADRLCAAPGARGRARRSRRVRRRRLPQRARPVRRVRVRRYARACGRGGLSRAGGRHRSLAHRSRPRAAALHRSEPAGSAEPVDPQTDLSRCVPAGAV